jgi:DNA-binding NtrC family response regulator
MNQEMKRVLVIEDDQEMQSLLIDFMQHEGFEVDSADDGFQACKKLVERTFDLVITDVRMPGLNGLDVLRGLKKIQPGVSIIVMTAFGGWEIYRKALQRGANGYLEKPLHLGTLRGLIHELFKPVEKMQGG